MAEAARMKLETESRTISITALDNLLRWEMTAVEAYNQCIVSIADQDIVDVLEDCRDQHLQRIEKLHAQIAKLGGVPRHSAGLAGRIARLFEGGVVLLSERAALGLLVEAEERILREYDFYLPGLDPQSTELLSKELIPGQIRSDRLMTVFTSIVYK